MILEVIFNILYLDIGLEDFVVFGLNLDNWIEFLL